MTIADRIVVINRGRIEQVGTQAEIYDQPRTRFVADFIGTMNFLEGRIEAGRFRTAGGQELPLPPSFERGEGDRVLSVRPEKIDIGAPGPNALLSGTVARAIRLGGLFEYAIELPGGATLVVQEQTRSGVQRCEAGATVGLSWQPQDGRLLPGDE